MGFRTRPPPPAAKRNRSATPGRDEQDGEEFDGDKFDGGTADARDTDERAPASGATQDERSQGERAAGREMGGHGTSLAYGRVRRDETLTDLRCVFQVLKRHYARYTPEMVQEACVVRSEQFLKVCEAVTANSGRERTTAWVYSVGWTHHSVGVQYIRGAAIIQLLLGNLGRPGGGIMALRGHASIQGSTDIPTLFNLLPGYLAERRPIGRRGPRSDRQPPGTAVRPRRPRWSWSVGVGTPPLTALYRDISSRYRDCSLGGWR